MNKKTSIRKRKNIPLPYFYFGLLFPDFLPVFIGPNAWIISRAVGKCMFPAGMGPDMVISAGQFYIMPLKKD